MECAKWRRAAIEYVNSEYVVFDATVADHLAIECHMVTEGCGTLAEARADVNKRATPFILMPEQVAVLIEYGLAKVMKLKEENRMKGERMEQSIQQQSTDVDNERLRKKAEMIAKGRKVKHLKRRHSADSAAATLKVRRCDIDSVEVTTSEINDTLLELSKAENRYFQDKTWLVPLCDAREEAYEEMQKPPFPESSVFRIRLNTFRDLWRRGYYLTCGLKFGCDYLAYETVPGEEHSKWLVKCVDSQDALSSLDLIALSRISSQVKKHVLLAIVSPDSLSPYYIEYSWWRSQRSQNIF